MNGAPNGSTDGRLRYVEQLLAKHTAYWEGQNKVNEAVQHAVEDMQCEQRTISDRTRKTQDSVTRLTGILKWVLGITTAVGIAVIVDIILR